MNVRLYVAQRLTAAIMVPLVAVHLAVILYATRHGLSAADVLARTRGSMVWALFYGIFVLAAAIHAPIGIRTVLAEWSPLRGRSADLVAAGAGLLLLVLGLRAVAAVVLP
jgi:fumarate reductase subunit C